MSAPNQTLVTVTLSVGKAPSEYRGQINFLPGETADLIAQIIKAARGADPTLDDRSNAHLPLLNRVAQLTDVVLVDWLNRALLQSRLEGLSPEQADLMVRQCQVETGALGEAIDRDAQAVTLWGVAERAGIVPALRDEGDHAVLGSVDLAAVEEDRSHSPGF